MENEYLDGVSLNPVSMFVKLALIFVFFSIAIWAFVVTEFPTSFYNNLPNNANKIDTNKYYSRYMILIIFALFLISTLPGMYKILKSKSKVFGIFFDGKNIIFINGDTVETIIYKNVIIIRIEIIRIYLFNSYTKIYIDYHSKNNECKVKSIAVDNWTKYGKNTIKFFERLKYDHRRVD